MNKVINMIFNENFTLVVALHKLALLFLLCVCQRYTHTQNMKKKKKKICQGSTKHLDILMRTVDKK